MITARDLSFGFGGRLVLAGVEVDIVPGEMVGLVGPNGSGKTTLLRLLYAALSPGGGWVGLDGVPLATLPTRRVAQRISVVSQEAPPDLPLTVGEMVLLGRMVHRSCLARYSDDDRWACSEALDRVGALRLAHRPFVELSGGERQRVLIARALAQSTEHLLLDEPTNHLDVRYQHETLALVRSLGLATIVVLHDLNLAARYCDRLILLNRGEVVAGGPVEEVLQPETIEPVYEMNVVRWFDDGCVQLSFKPRPDLPGLRRPEVAPR